MQDITKIEDITLEDLKGSAQRGYNEAMRKRDAKYPVTAAIRNGLEAIKEDAVPADGRVKPFTFDEVEGDGSKFTLGHTVFATSLMGNVQYIDVTHDQQLSYVYRDEDNELVTVEEAAPTVADIDKAIERFGEMAWNAKQIAFSRAAAPAKVVVQEANQVPEHMTRGIPHHMKADF